MFIKVLDVSAEEDLQEFTGFLWRLRIPHRVRSTGGGQELWLGRSSDVDFVVGQYQRWKQGLPFSNSQPDAPVVAGRVPAGAWLKLAPVTTVLIALSLLLTLLTSFGRDVELLRWFTFVNFESHYGEPLSQGFSTMMAQGQWWRLITPIFLHFSLIHLVFNLLWIWELGRRMELLYSRNTVVVLVGVIAVVSNTGQFFTGYPVFGGLSGVVFGLLAYAWFWDRLVPEHRFGLPPMLMVLMLGWLVFGVSGLPERLGLGSFANVAHLVGLLAGLACVPVVSVFRNRLWRDSGSL